ncbi:MAG: hypothetical protein ACOCQ5_06125 [Halanaerobiales bacterium]
MYIRYSTHPDTGQYEIELRRWPKEADHAIAVEVLTICRAGLVYR